MDWLLTVILESQDNQNSGSLKTILHFLRKGRKLLYIYLWTKPLCKQNGNQKLVYKHHQWQMESALTTIAGNELPVGN